MKRLALILLTTIIATGLTLVPVATDSSETKAQDKPQLSDELIELRTRTSKTYYLGDSHYALEASPNSIHYKDNLDDPSEQWKDIDTTIQTSNRTDWNWEVVKGHWHLLIKDDTSVALGKDGNWIGFRYEGFAYYDTESKEYAILDNRRDVTPTIDGNKIRWEGLFYGVNLEYTYTPDRFKEDLEVTQVARDWLTSNPPSSFGLNNQTSYLVGYLECDWRNAYPAEDDQGNLVNFDNLEHEGKSIFWRHPVKGYLFTALPTGWARHSDLMPEEWVKIRHRFYKATNGKHYLLFGSKVALLNQMPSGTIDIDPTATYYPDSDPEASSVDGFVYESTVANWATIRAAAGDGADDLGDDISVGLRCYSSSPNFDRLYRSIILFNTSGLPDDCTVTAATLSVYSTYKINDTGDADLAFNVYQSNPASNTALAAGDYDCLSTTPLSTNIAYNDWITANPFWNDFALNAAGLALISKTSVTKLGIREATHDAGGATATWVNAQWARVAFYQADKGVGYKPKLVVTYVTTPTVTSDNSTNVEEYTALLSGNVTVSSENITERGFEWGTSTGSYTDNTTEIGSWPAGIFSANATGLSPGTTYYWRAMAYNSGGWGYGGELYFTTKPLAPTVLTDTTRTSSQITLTWTLGTGSENTTVRYRSDGVYPTGYTDGTLGYSGTAATCNVTGLTGGQEYKIGAWAVNTDNTTIYSDASAQLTAFTLPGDPSNLATSNPACTSLDLDWTKGTGGDRTHIRRKAGSYPTDVTDGTQAYFNTSNSTTDSGLSAATAYYYRGWAYDTDSTYYSGNYTQATGNTSAIFAPTVTTTANATGITATTATVEGNITAINCENASTRGFQWGNACGNLTDNWTEGGSFGTGAFTHEITGLSANTTYYFRALAANSGGTGYGACDNFTTTLVPPTLPGPPTNFVITQYAVNSVNLTWTMGTGATTTVIRVSTTSYPSSPTDGYEVYNDTGTSANHTGLSLALETYYYRAWSNNAVGYSIDYAQGQIGGNTMAFVALALLVIGMTIGAFSLKNLFIGILASISWLLLGFWGFTTSSATWDLYYGLGFFSLGLAVATFIAALGLRARPEGYGNEVSAEDKEIEEYINEREKIYDTQDRIRQVSATKKQFTRARRREQRITGEGITHDALRRQLRGK